MKKIYIPQIKKRKGQQKLTMLTAYDFPTAKLVDQSGIDIILVGDSLGNVVLGYPNTIPVTIDEIIHHTAAVCRATKHALVVADMPFLSYHVSQEQAIENAGKLMKLGGADAVKLEGGKEFAPLVHTLTQRSIPVMGHIGLTPQSLSQIGGYKVQGKTAQHAQKLLQDARELENAGAFAIVLECIPTEVAKEITQSLSIPTIGIGAGPHCDGQVLVLHDLLGLQQDFQPKFVKQYANLSQIILQALQEFKHEVQNQKFPSSKHSFSMPPQEKEKFPPHRPNI